MKRVLKVIFISIIIAFGVFLFINTGRQSENKVLKNPVRIVYVTDDKYVIPLRASIKSLISNKNPQTELEINVIGVNLSDKNIKKIQSARQNKININILKLDNKYLDFEGGADLNPLVSRADTAKFFLSSILSGIDRVIYLDGDTVVLGDLSDLYNTDLKDKYLAVTDDLQTLYEKEDKKERYFNNGVMLIDLKKFRRDKIDDKLQDYKINDMLKRFVTQDAYNNVLYGKVVYVPMIYDTFAPIYEDKNVLNYIEKVLGKHYNPDLYPYKNQKEYQDNVKIIHYCGYCNIKPWWEFMPEYRANRIWYKYAPWDYWKNLLSGKKVKYKKCNLLRWQEEAEQREKEARKKYRK